VSAAAEGAAWGIKSEAASARLPPRSRWRHPGTLPNPKLPAGTDTLPEIEHIVIVMQENHSFDNYLGTLGRGDGLALGPDGLPSAANPASDGSAVRIRHLERTTQHMHVPTQTWAASHLQLGG